MAKLNSADVIASLKEMSIAEVMDLVSAIEKEFGVTAAAPVAAAAAAPVAGAAAAAPSEVTLTLKSFGASKVKVIKAVQEITGLGLMDAKKLVDAVPSVIKEKISPAEANDYASKLKEAGAETEVK
jgi:large subunit ribosomal protein L7/L12